MAPPPQRRRIEVVMEPLAPQPAAVKAAVRRLSAGARERRDYAKRMLRTPSASSTTTSASTRPNSPRSARGRREFALRHLNAVDDDDDNAGSSVASAPPPRWFVQSALSRNERLASSARMASRSGGSATASREQSRRRFERSLEERLDAAQPAMNAFQRNQARERAQRERAALKYDQMIEQRILAKIPMRAREAAGASPDDVAFAAARAAHATRVAAQVADRVASASAAKQPERRRRTKAEMEAARDEKAAAKAARESARVAKQSANAAAKAARAAQPRPRGRRAPAAAPTSAEKRFVANVISKFPAAF